jgi:hypothetical protein
MRIAATHLKVALQWNFDLSCRVYRFAGSIVQFPWLPVLYRPPHLSRSRIHHSSFFRTPPTKLVKRDFTVAIVTSTTTQRTQATRILIISRATAFDTLAHCNSAQGARTHALLSTDAFLSERQIWNSGKEIYETLPKGLTSFGHNSRASELTNVRHETTPARI